MILPDDAPESPIKQAHALQEAEAHSSAQPQNPPPPAYPGYSSYQQGNPLYIPQPIPVPRPSSPIIVNDFEPAGRRFIRAFIYAILIYALVGLFTGSLVEVASLNRRRNRNRTIIEPPPHEHWPPSEPDEAYTRCVTSHLSWSPFNNTSVVNFLLPVYSKLTYVHSSGSLSRGDIEILLDPQPVDDVYMRISVTAHDATDELLDQFQVCHVSSNDNRGVVIRTPERKVNNVPSNFKFSIRVGLPAAVGGRVLDLDGFRTILPGFHHEIQDLKRAVSFDTFLLRSQEASVHSQHHLPYNLQGLTADNIDVIIENGAIMGEFRAAESITMITKNAPINTQLQLMNGGLNSDPSKIRLSTTNANIASSVTLISLDDGAEGGSYDVMATTQNGPVSLTFPNAPLSSKLKVLADTNNCGVTVGLHRGFEGNFVLSSNQYTGVEYDNHAEDPYGRGRKRFVHARHVGKATTGSTSWGLGNSDSQHLGDVTLHTTKAPVILKLL
ncbi:hypothetical protein C8Q75DRAFT_722385 [Abortiporus biennis]|nr:hypothetical protein C8Q75DRAFT_722385 [Abortiporus biennis]